MRATHDEFASGKCGAKLSWSDSAPLNPDPSPGIEGDISRRKLRVLVKRFDESGQQIGGPVDVVQGDHLDGTVHVAVGDAHQPRGHARPVDLDRVRVGAVALPDAAS